MKLTIKNIILYPKDTSKNIRTITFHPDKVNVIRGNSHRGKSAITHIVDYCLGSYECNIPVLLIRDVVSKFGIIIQVANSEIFIARDNPEEKNSTDVMYMFESHSITPGQMSNKAIYEGFERIKTSRGDVINRMNELAGFSNQRFDALDSKNNWNDSASFRDTTAFQFQPQPIVANPTTLFYKTDTYKHQNKLRTIFPLILGYKTDDIIAIEREIEDIESRIQEKEAQLQKEEMAYDAWKSDVYKFFYEATRLGLTTQKIDRNTSDISDLLIELENIIGSVNSGQLFKNESSVAFIDLVSDLNNKRNDLTSKLDDLRLDLSKLKMVDESKDSYNEHVVKVKLDRLKPVSWFIRESGHDDACPFCGETSEKAKNQLLQLKTEELRNKEIATIIESSDVSLDKQINVLKKQIRDVEDEILEIDKVFMSNQNESNVPLNKILLFTGRAEQVIINVKNASPSSFLRDEILQLQDELERKKQEKASIHNSFPESFALSQITKYISNYTNLLDIEDGTTNEVILDVESLTVKIKDKKRDKPYYLSRVGSGANHLGYHLATLMGLHQYFLNLAKHKRKNYVPSFLIIDQPSQVYFPKKVSKTPKDEDMRNTKKIFEACSAFITNTKGNVQVIVLEHAPKDAWKDIDNIHLVEEWESDSKELSALIPQSWT